MPGLRPQHGFKATGLRYFNVFGPARTHGAYAAVIPKWIAAMMTVTG